MPESKKAKTAATAIERYARQNIPESNKAFGEFMYHAELLRRGHTAIHKKDAQSLPAKYKQIIDKLYQDA